MSTEVRTLDFDSHVEALGHVHRRRLLRALLEADPDAETPVDIEQFGRGTDTRDLKISMHHVHLPKLESLGLVRTDRERQHVGRGPNFEEIEPLLRILDENRDELPADWA